MAVDPSAPAASLFELKSAVMTLVSVVLRSADHGALAQALDERFGQTPNLFDHEPVVLDIAPLAEAGDPIDFESLLALLRRHGMLPIAARGGSAAQMEAAQAAGLTEAPQPVPARTSTAQPPPEPQTESQPQAPASAAAAPEPVSDGAAAPFGGALLVDRPLRSGQQVYARGRDLVVLASVNFGAEVIADGSIHVYAPLRGRAIAGARGDTDARIYCTCLEAQLIAIAGTYRTAENPLPDEVLGKPAQVRLEGDRLVIEALGN